MDALLPHNKDIFWQLRSIPSLPMMPAFTSILPNWWAGMGIKITSHVYPFP
jgi:hypothetical protein